MKCSECGSLNRVENTVIGEICCADCGLVLSWNPIEEYSIVKSLNEDEKKPHGAFRKVHFTNENLGSNIFPTDKKSRRLAYTQYTQSDKYRGGVTPQDKHFIVCCKQIIYQYGLPDTHGEILAQCKSTKKRLAEKGLLRGYSTEVRANVISYLHLKEHSSIRRHSTITGESVKRLGRLSRKFAKHMHTRQLIGVRSPSEMISTVLTNLETNGIEFTNEFRNKCYILSEYIAKSLDEMDKPYKNSTNATVVWLVGLMENEKIKQQDITDVSEVTVQTIRSTLRNIIYPMFKVDKKTLEQLSVDEFVNGIRKEK